MTVPLTEWVPNGKNTLADKKAVGHTNRHRHELSSCGRGGGRGRGKGRSGCRGRGSVRASPGSELTSEGRGTRAIVPT